MFEEIISNIKLFNPVPKEGLKYLSPLFVRKKLIKLKFRIMPPKQEKGIHAAGKGKNRPAKARNKPPSDWQQVKNNRKKPPDKIQIISGKREVKGPSDMVKYLT